MYTKSSTQLGAQIWLEPTDGPERIHHLFQAASDTGLGWVRLFLMWPFIEPRPGEWHFALYDHAFAAAQRHDIRIKATLTANSGPWHVGSPSMLHASTGFLSPEHRTAAGRYLEACVRRYAGHPALGQWILWNEPDTLSERSPEALAHWQAWVQAHYAGDLGQLNADWGSGYTHFSELPFAEEVPHLLHQQHVWNAYAPGLQAARARAAWLAQQVAWVGAQVRALDPHTPHCVNPTALFVNQAARGVDLDALAQCVEMVGASYHPAWHFTFAPRSAFPLLMAAGVRLQAALPSVRRVEVTEVQTGNTLTSGLRPSSASPSEIVRFFLASLAAGAESVTGWCFNARSRDFEAGDWGLLDDLDQPSPRSRAIRLLHDRLERVLERTGPWSAAPTRAWVILDPEAQALEWIEGRALTQMNPSTPDDGAQGAGLLCAQLMALGVVATPTRLAQVPDHARPGDLVVASQVVAWEASSAARLLRFAESGGTLVLDATSGRKTPDARLHRPWPGGLASAMGLRASGLETHPTGVGVCSSGIGVGRFLGALMTVEFQASHTWKAWSNLRLEDGEACVWEREFGQGRVVVVRGTLGPSLLHQPNFRVPRVLFERLLGASVPVHPVGSHPAACVIPVEVAGGQLWVLLAPDAPERRGHPVRLRVPDGRWHELWTDQEVSVSADGEVCLEAPDGVGLLWVASSGWG